MYAVVEFPALSECEVIPIMWIENIATIAKENLIKKNVRVYWPNYPSTSKISRAVRKACMAETDWPLFDARVLGTAGIVAFILCVV